eukprot:scaffold686_cov234-Pinguiococcus_pyrenoidosus.AAC.6
MSGCTFIRGSVALGTLASAPWAVRVCAARRAAFPSTSRTRTRTTRGGFGTWMVGSIRIAVANEFWPTTISGPGPGPSSRSAECHRADLTKLDLDLALVLEDSQRWAERQHPKSARKQRSSARCAKHERISSSRQTWARNGASDLGSVRLARREMACNGMLAS